jgi:hypothetical protein
MPGFEPGAHADAVFLGLLDEHLAFTVHRGQHVAAVERDEQLGDLRQRTEPIADRAQHVSMPPPS